MLEHERVCRKQAESGLQREAQERRDAEARVRELEAERDILDARVNQLEETLRVIRAWDMLNPSGDVERFADAPWLRREIDAALHPSTPPTEENENGD